MPQSIVLEVNHPSLPPGRIEGFRFLWAFYVNGYKPELHCQRCFRGRRVPQKAMNGGRITLDRIDRFPFVYVCGVGVGPKPLLWKQNLHFPMQYSEGSTAVATTYNGYTFRALNAIQLPIPELPEGWEGKPRAHVRCRNFQFAVGYFGYPPRAKTDELV